MNPVFRTRASAVLLVQEVTLFHAEEDHASHSNPGISVPSRAGRGQSLPPSFPLGGRDPCPGHPVSLLGGRGRGSRGRGYYQGAQM